jgi:hypothetical protein
LPGRFQYRSGVRKLLEALDLVTGNGQNMTELAYERLASALVFASIAAQHDHGVPFRHPLEILPLSRSLR